MENTMYDMTHEHSQGRRRFLQALFGGAVLLISGRAADALAEATRAPNQSPGELKSSCDKHGGVYIDSKKDDVQACFWSNKAKTVCKFDGTGCWNYDPPKPPKGLENNGPIVDPFDSVNWHELEQLAGVDAPVVGDPISTPAVVTSPAATPTGRRKRRGKRRKH
jgi:hypothetical protein